MKSHLYIDLMSITLFSKTIRPERLIGSALACSAFLLMPLQSILAEDYNQPIPENAFQLESPMDGEFSQHIEPETKFSELLKSSEVSLKLRNYYLNRDKPDGPDSYGWAQGGILAHKMGRIDGIFSMNTELMGSYPLDTPDDHGGTLLVGKNGNSLTTFGVVNPRLMYAGQVLSVYRQRYSLPYVNEQDNRMLPNTFEGYTLGQPIGSSKKFQYIVGYIDSMKKRNSEDFVSMSDAAGASQVDRGMLVGGARAFPIPEWSLAAIDYYVSDVLNIVYADSNYKFMIAETIENNLSAQYSEQSTVGDNLLNDRDYSTGFWGIQNASSYEGLIFKAALNFNDGSADIVSPYGSYPGYNSSIVEDFNRAGENSWQVALSYDLAKVGLQGFRVATAFIQGNAAVDGDTGAAIPDKSETDVTLDYRRTEGLLKGLWVRLRSATIDDESVGTTQDYRVIVNYDITLFGSEKAAN